MLLFIIIFSMNEMIFSDQFKQKVIGFLAFLVGRLLYFTLFIHEIRHPDIQPKEQYIYCFWHGKQFMPLMCMHRLGNQKHVALVSASQDGTMLATWLQAMGYKVVRGSSSRKAVSGLKKLLNAARQGYSLGLAADGPRGPIFEAKSGAIYLAAKTGIKIVPIGTAYQHAIQLKAWDKYQVPKLFSKSCLYLGEPIEVPKQVTEDITELNNYTEMLSNQLNLAQVKAEAFGIHAVNQVIL